MVRTEACCDNSKEKRVLLGMSGGVDSAASCILLQKMGFTVTGYCFDIKGDPESDVIKKASLACSQLGIELIAEDVSDDFDRLVISDFCRSYTAGETPNPCVICNPLIKFRKLTECADRLGIAHIATGHYAGIEERDGVFYIKRALNAAKDQSYMLYRLGQDVLSRVIFPLGETASKDEIRTIAGEYGLDCADASDSQEICFISPDDDYVSYIKRRGFKSEPGDFTDASGNKLGQHSGIINYTVGQRKGLGIALGHPAFVTSINAGTNTVTLGSNEDLFSREAVTRDNFFTCGSPEKYEGKTLLAKPRYAAKPSAVVIKREQANGSSVIRVTFEEPQRAMTPGQSMVFYDGELLIGGGFICRS